LKALVWAILVILAGVLVVGYVLKRLPETAAVGGPRRAVVEWSGVTDDPSEHLTISIISPSADLVPEAPGIRTLEERFNVTLEMGAIHPTAWSKKKPMLLASGKMPDVFFDGGNQLKLAIKHGFIIPVPLAVIAEHAPTHMRLVRQYAGYAWPAGMAGDVNYSVPMLWMDSRYPRTGTWRMDWLRNAGIETVPETLTEMYEALSRFRHDDPARVTAPPDTHLPGDLHDAVWRRPHSDLPALPVAGVAGQPPGLHPAPADHALQRDSGKELLPEHSREPARSGHR